MKVQITGMGADFVDQLCLLFSSGIIIWWTDTLSWWKMSPWLKEESVLIYATLRGDFIIDSVCQFGHSGNRLWEFETCFYWANLFYWVSVQCLSFPLQGPIVLSLGKNLFVEGFWLLSKDCHFRLDGYLLPRACLGEGSMLWMFGLLPHFLFPGHTILGFVIFYILHMKYIAVFKINLNICLLWSILIYCDFSTSLLRYNSHIIKFTH